MKTKEFKDLIIKLDETVKHTSMNTVFDDIVNFFDIVNYINNNMNEHDIEKIDVKGRKAFLFIKSDDLHDNSVILRNMCISGLKTAKADCYGMNRNAEKTTKFSIYAGNINGIWTNTVWYFEHKVDADTRKVIAHQLYNYIKSFNNIFNPNWIR